jgi:hypothetical protein
MVVSRPLPDFTGYQVSKCGKVFGLSGKELRCSSDRRGYLRVWCYSNKKRHEVYVHRAVATAWVEGDTSLTVNHMDGNKKNNNAANLEWITNADNLRHSFKSGLRDNTKAWVTRRKKNRGLRLVPEDMQLNIIKAYQAENVSLRELGRRFKVSRGTVGLIIKRRNVVC